MTDFRLTDGEKSSSLWLRLRAHLEERLVVARMRNDHDTLTPIETAVIRGQIKSLKSLIELGNDPPLTGEREAPRGASSMGME